MGALIQELGQSPVIPLIAVLIDGALKGLALLVLAWLLIPCCRRMSASGRHLLWALVLVGLIVLPVLGPLVPKWQWRILPPSGHASAPADPAETSVARVSAEMTAPATEARIRGEFGTGRPADSMPGNEGTLRGSAGIDEWAGEESSGFADGELAVSPSGIETAPRASHEPQAAVERGPGGWWLMGILATWLMGVVAALSPLLIGWIVTRRIARRGRVCEDAALRGVVEELRGVLEVRPAVRLVLGPEGAMPMTWGLARPVLLLPEDARDWSRERLCAILLHELAHVRRRDCLTHGLARLGCALHWFNPLAWAALGRLHAERERACDDAVLAAGAPASDYAEHLLAIATQTRAMAPATLTMARPSQIEGRVLALFDAARSRRPVTRGLFAGAAVTAGALTLTLAVLQPAAQEPKPESGTTLAMEHDLATRDATGISREEALRRIEEYGGFYRINETDEVTSVSLVYDEIDGERVETQRTDDTIAEVLPAFPKLKTLLLREGQATDAAMEYVGQLAELERLYLWDAQVTDAGVAKLTGLKNLEYLHISNAGLGDEALRHISRLKTLETISMQKNDFTDTGLAYLGDMPELEKIWVGIGNSRFNGTSFEVLKNLPKLRFIQLAKTDASEETLLKLAEFPQLESIFFERDSEIAPLALAKLKLAAPELKIGHPGIQEAEKMLEQIELRQYADELLEFNRRNEANGSANLEPEARTEIRYYKEMTRYQFAWEGEAALWMGPKTSASGLSLIGISFEPRWRERGEYLMQCQFGVSLLNPNNKSEGTVAIELQLLDGMPEAAFRQRTHVRPYDAGNLHWTTYMTLPCEPGMEFQVRVARLKDGLYEEARDLGHVVIPENEISEVIFDEIFKIDEDEWKQRYIGHDEIVGPAMQFRLLGDPTAARPVRAEWADGARRGGRLLVDDAPFFEPGEILNVRLFESNTQPKTLDRLFLQLTPEAYARCKALFFGSPYRDYFPVAFVHDGKAIEYEWLNPVGDDHPNEVYFDVSREVGRAVVDGLRAQGVKTPEVQQGNREPAFRMGELAAPKPGFIRLKVLDEQGQPLEKAYVANHVQTGTEEGWNWVNYGRENPYFTDTQGIVEIPLPPGNYSRTQAYVHDVQRGLGGFVVLPQTADAKVRTVTLKPLTTVRGTIECEDGDIFEASNSVTVEVGTGSGGMKLFTHFSWDRQFEFKLPEGGYQLSANTFNTLRYEHSFGVKAGEKERVLPTVRLEPDGLFKLRGKPAPELTKVVGWRNTDPLALAQLRGKAVLLYFFNSRSIRNNDTGREIPFLMTLYKDLRDEGLVVILLDQNELNSVEQIQLDEDDFQTNGTIGGNERVIWTPDAIPIALAPGTRAEYGFRYNNGAVLIDPEGICRGRFKFGQNYPEAARELRGLLRAAGEDDAGLDDAGDEAWRARFEEIYGLADGEVLKFIPRPYPPERQQWYGTDEPSQAAAIPEGPEVLRWQVDEQGNGRKLGMMFSPPMTVNRILPQIGLSDLDVEFESGLATREMRGDWVIREGATEEQLMAAFEEIMRERIAPGIRARRIEREKEVIVAKGQFTGRIPFGPSDSAGAIYVYETATEDPDGRSSQYDPQRFFGHLQRVLRMPVIDETLAPRPRMIWAQFNNLRIWETGVDSEQRLRVMRVLHNLTVQTGVEFAIEKRTMPGWRIERDPSELP